MNKEPYIPPPEVRERLVRNVYQAVADSAYVDAMLDILIVKLEAEIRDSPGGRWQATRQKQTSQADKEPD
ncbi:MAG: hypothetical protein H7Y22_03035 [Gemmatimonadaceae bacterium]|nr:hypothetical protein [Gloeobacterales cyanobacterium ES-bin-141]